MTAFAKLAEREEWIPGRLFWIPAHGKMEHFMASLVSFAEARLQSNLRENERYMLNHVFSAVKECLTGSTGRWLLCIDNADDSCLNGAIADPTRGTGWFLVTLRQRGAVRWDGMQEVQKLQLKPLHLKPAIILLLRRKGNKDVNKYAEDQILSQLEELKLANRREHNILSNIVADKHFHGLGGLPLALSQAGMFICRSRLHFQII